MPHPPSKNTRYLVSSERTTGRVKLELEKRIRGGSFPNNVTARVRPERVKQTVREFFGNIKTLWPRSGAERHYNYSQFLLRCRPPEVKIGSQPI